MVKWAWFEQKSIEVKYCVPCYNPFVRGWVCKRIRTWHFQFREVHKWVAFGCAKQTGHLREEWCNIKLNWNDHKYRAKMNMIYFVDTLSLSSANSILKSPIYDRLQIWAYRSYCTKRDKRKIRNLESTQPKQKNNFMAGSIKLAITSVNSSGKRSREAEVAISRLIELTFLISQLSTRTWTYQNTESKSTKIMSTSQCKISIYA